MIIPDKTTTAPSINVADDSYTDVAGNKGSGANQAWTANVEAPKVMFVEDNAPDDGALTADEFVAGNQDGANEISVNIKVPAGVTVADAMVLKVTDPKGNVTEHSVTQEVIDNGLTLNYPIADFPKDVNRTVSAELVDDLGNVSEPAKDTLVNAIEPPTLTVDLQDFIDVTDPATAELATDRTTITSEGAPDTTVVIKDAKGTVLAEVAVDADGTYIHALSTPLEADTIVTAETKGSYPVMADVTGTSTNAPGSTVTIKIGEYDENGQLITAEADLVEVTATVNEDGTYSTKADVSSLMNTDMTGDKAQDVHTIGAVATNGYCAWR